jgi:hypothetical protein
MVRASQSAARELPFPAALAGQRLEVGRRIEFPLANSAGLLLEKFACLGVFHEHLAM